MELLIPGLILVALMVYASTRIKKTAAAAFEPESVSGAGFTLEKPEGFLSVIGGDSSLEFEAYSREFGTTAGVDARQALVEVRRLTDPEGESAGSTEHQIVDGVKYTITESTRLDKGVTLRDIRKTARSGDGYLQLKVTRMDETNEDVARKIDMLIASFRVAG